MEILRYSKCCHATDMTDFSSGLTFADLGICSHCGEDTEYYEIKDTSVLSRVCSGSDSDCSGC